MPGSDARLVAVNSSGVAVGHSYWNIRTNEYRRPPGSGGAALNGNGWVVTGDGLSDGNTTVPLQDPADLTPTSPPGRVGVVALSDDGQVIVGTASQAGSGGPVDTRPVVWRCR
jgi:hypothetical protein